MASRPALVDVDTQRDFMTPGGALYIPGSEEILPQVERLLAWGAEEHLVRLASVDAHPPTSREFEKWPPHCIPGTEGQKKVPATSVPDSLVLPGYRLTVLPNLNVEGEIIFETDDIDLFTNPNVDAVLATLKLREFVVFGVATEHCVKAAVMGLLKRGKLVSVVTDAVHGIDPTAARWALDEMRLSGARLVTTDEVAPLKVGRT